MQKKNIASLKTFGTNQYIDGYRIKNSDHNHIDFFLSSGTMLKRSTNAIMKMKLFKNNIA